MDDKYVLIERYAYRMGVALGFWREHTFKLTNNRRYSVLKDNLERFFDDAIAIEYDNQTK